MHIKVSNTLLSKLKIIEDMGYGIKPQATIMDFGCGSGGTVQELRNLGYQSFGCDMEFKHQKNVDTEKMKESGMIRLIARQPYKLPFDDGTFDFVFSDQVFEHVKNYSESISEISRILKPGGFCLHIFPSRYKPIEPHVYIPFSSIVRLYPWLYFWAMFGIRNEYQKGLSASVAAKRTRDYLNKNTNYLTKKQISEHFRAYFRDVQFCENLFLKYSDGGRYIYSIAKTLPALITIYSTFHSRVVFAAQPKKNVGNVK